MATGLLREANLTLARRRLTVSVPVVLLVLGGSIVYGQSASFNMGLSGNKPKVEGSVTGGHGAACYVEAEANLIGPPGQHSLWKYGSYWVDVRVDLTYEANSQYDLYAYGLADFCDGWYSNYFDWRYIVTPPPNPRITSLNPSSGPPGQTGTMTISGQDLDHAEAILADGPISFTIIYVGASSVQAYYTIASDASPGSFNVQVDLSSGYGSTNTLSFTITP